MVDVPDPRTEKDGICGVTVKGATGIEWVCVKEIHQKVYRSKKPPGYRLGDNLSAHQHYFVNKWPYRPTRKEGT